MKFVSQKHELSDTKTKGCTHALSVHANARNRLPNACCLRASVVCSINSAIILIHPSIHPSIHPACIHALIHTLIHALIHAFIHLSIHLSIHPSICLPTHSSTWGVVGWVAVTGTDERRVAGDGERDVVTGSRDHTSLRVDHFHLATCMHAT